MGLPKARRGSCGAKKHTERRGRFRKKEGPRAQLTLLLCLICAFLSLFSSAVSSVSLFSPVFLPATNDTIPLGTVTTATVRVRQRTQNHEEEDKTTF